jgi:hypothetical protein
MNIDYSGNWTIIIFIMTIISSPLINAISLILETMVRSRSKLKVYAIVNKNIQEDDHGVV